MIVDPMSHRASAWPLRPRRAIAGNRPLKLAYLRKTQLRKFPKAVAGMLLRQEFASGPKSMPSGPCLRALQLCRYGEDFGYCFGYYMGNLPIFVISMGCFWPFLCLAPQLVPRNNDLMRPKLDA